MIFWHILEESDLLSTFSVDDTEHVRNIEAEEMDALTTTIITINDTIIKIQKWGHSQNFELQFPSSYFSNLKQRLPSFD